jgi:hypothetical protein
MIESIVLKEKDFLQQFPGSDQYTQGGLPYTDWWETGDDPKTTGKPVDIAAMFGGVQMTQA